MDECVIIEFCLIYVNGIVQLFKWYFGFECDGGFIQYICVDVWYVYVVCFDLFDIEFVLFFCFYLIVENMLICVVVGLKDIVFVIGVLGGVGLVVI